MCDHGASLARPDAECQDDCYILSECAHVNELLAEFVGYFLMVANLLLGVLGP